MIRSIVFLVGLWALMATPVLCTTGALAHECHCEDEQVCEHEAECHSDPCGDALLRKDESGQDPGEATFTGPAPVVRSATIALRVAGPAPDRFPDRAPPPALRHASDLPLLS